MTVGEIQPSDPFNSNRDSGEIIWKGSDLDTTWHKLPNLEGYRSAIQLQPSLSLSYSRLLIIFFRYLKFEVTRIGPSDVPSTGRLIINELIFYEGYLSQIEIPNKYSKLQSPRTPSPLRVSCSSFLDQSHHCYKAFDGDSSSGSSWITKPVSEHRDTLSATAWIILDLGLNVNETLSPTSTLVPPPTASGRRVRPTGMKIVCGAGNTLSPEGCPMTFSLSGSNQLSSSDYELITSYDLYDFNTSVSEYYSANTSRAGRMFSFYEESPYGRLVNQRCGSCDRPPTYQCSTNGYDPSCESPHYCGANNLCQEIQQCPPGQYLSQYFLGNGLTEYSCQYCPSGKYGQNNISGHSILNSHLCSGECQEGCYCPIGSTSSCEYPCGEAKFFCPSGTSIPLVASAGMKTVDAFGKSFDNSSTSRVAVLPCSPGHYCQEGIENLCPAGVYGIDRMLTSSSCSGSCPPGSYCPVGTIEPLLCPIGSYCPDGVEKVPCPAGSYGDQEGLTNRDCSGKCQPGYYCPQGSGSPRQEICPKGLLHLPLIAHPVYVSL
jgi:hypothetical protein